MQISVIIPSYNRAHTLDRALDSVFNQTCPAAEVIVVDDGSSDGTVALLRQRYPQVRLFSTANRGVSAARNHGIEQSRFPWLAFLDSDDAWLPQKLEKQVHALQRQTHYRLVHGDEVWIRNGIRVNPMKKHAKTGGWIFQHCLPLCAISPSAVLLQRTVFTEVGLFDTGLPACEDYDMWLRICARMPVLYVDEPLLLKYGGHEDQLSRRFWGMDRFRIQALKRIIDAGILNAADDLAARQMLVRKAGIVLNGAKKRDRSRDVQEYRQLIHAYSGHANGQNVPS